MSEHTLTPPADRSVKVPHLVFGLLFLGLTGIWALAAGEVIGADSLPLVGPAVLIAAGVVGLVASLAVTRNRARRSPIAPENTENTENTQSYDEES